MNLQGAESGRVALISNPIQVAVVVGDSASVVSARLRWIPPKVEGICRVSADFYLRQLTGGAPDKDLLESEQHMLMMSWSLRRDDGVHSEQVFAFPDVMDEKNRLHARDELLFQNLHDAEIRSQCADPQDLWAAYEDFKLAEFPPYPGPEQMQELYEDAKKKSLVTLLSERDYWTVLRALRGMERLVRASRTSSTTAGRP